MTKPRPAAPPEALAPGPTDDHCLGFANTRYWRGSAQPTEQLQAPKDLLLWCDSVNLLDADTLRAAQAEWEHRPAEASAYLADAIALRESLYRLFAAAVAKSAPAPHDLLRLETALQKTSVRTHLRNTATGYRWTLTPGKLDLTVLLAPVLWSAGDLLAGPRLARLRQCANEKCRWLFVDDSKTGNRRWCMMSACGNRAKAHRHYAKIRAAKSV